MTPSRIGLGRDLRARAGGFSLVEMLVVLALMALVVGTGVPWISKISRRNTFRSAAAEIQSTLLAARMRAVRLNAPASVLVVTATATSSAHLLETIEPDRPAPIPTPNPARTLPISTAALTFLTLPVAQKITFDGNGRRISPAGGVPADIVVEGPTGAGDRNQITIRTSLTGRVEVVTPAVWQ